MSHWLESGVFDQSAMAEGTQPESDLSKFNGAVWARARALFLGGDPAPDPAHPRWDDAIDYYEQRAAGSEFEWSWSGREEDLTTFTGLIDRSDRAAQAAVVVGAAIAANHLVAAVDAWLATRLRTLDGGRGLPSLSVLPRRYASGERWVIRIDWSIG